MSEVYKVAQKCTEYSFASFLLIPIHLKKKKHVKNSQNIICRRRKKRVPGMLTVVLLKKGCLGQKTTKKIARVQRPVILTLLTSIWFAMVYSQ